MNYEKDYVLKSRVEMKIVQKLLIFLLTLVFTLSIYTAATPMPGKVSIEITPSPIELAPNEQIKGVLMIRNNSSMPVHELEISILNNSHVQIVPQILKFSDLQPHRIQLWNITFTRQGTESTVGKVYFKLRYQQREVSNIILQSLQIQDRLSTPIAKIATARIETTLELLQERQNNLVYVIVTNISNSPIKITQIHPNSPSFLNIPTPNIADGIILDPQATHIFPMTAIANDTVYPGKHMIIFEVNLEWKEDGYLRADKLIVTHKFDAGIVGESEILRLVGAPIFLLLPGILMVYIFKILWNLSAPKQGMANITLNPTAPEFWVFAILLSLLTPFIYPVLTDSLGNRRDYLVTYGLFDIFLVWIGSVFAGFLIWVLFAGSIGIYLWIVSWRERQITPSENDNAEKLLEKLGKKHANMLLEQIDVASGSELLRYFIAAPVTRDKTKVWAIPPVVYEFLPQTPPDFMEKFNNRLNQQTIEPLVQLIQQDEGKHIKLDWKHYGKGPIQVDRRQVTPKLSQGHFLEEAGGLE
ncbi:MAG TPA: hypothetical protein DCE56_12900 [Cyanobacteria bacterium UBA8553]|nr:hypothetical protein [Cyanobacteria bacterium UBA8553]